jgi:hypothetical protein
MLRTLNDCLSPADTHNSPEKATEAAIPLQQLRIQIIEELLKGM